MKKELLFWSGNKKLLTIKLSSIKKLKVKNVRVISKRMRIMNVNWTNWLESSMIYKKKSNFQINKFLKKLKSFPKWILWLMTKTLSSEKMWRKYKIYRPNYTKNLSNSEILTIVVPKQYKMLTFWQLKINS